MGLLGILAALGLLIWLSFRGWSVLLLAATAREPLLAHWTQTFMGSAAQFIAQFFPIFLLGALFGKLMDDSGSVQTIANFMSTKLGHQRAILAVVLAGALVADGARIVPGGEHPATADAGNDRSRHVDLHHVGHARDTGDSEHHPHAIFRNDAIRGARAGNHRLGDHAGVWI